MTKTKKPQIKSATREWIESFIIAFILAMVIRSYFLQPFKIPSGSMRMTLIEGDRLFVNKLRYGPLLFPFRYSRLPEQWQDLASTRLPGFSEPKRGDIIVFVYPEDPTKDFIKRLIAFPGEKVELREGDIYINGKLVDQPNIKNIFYYNRGQYGMMGQTFVVPDGQYFVLGDNSGSSHDSRYWGFVPKEHVIGKAEFIFWPPNRIRILK